MTNKYKRVAYNSYFYQALLPRGDQDPALAIRSKIEKLGVSKQFWLGDCRTALSKARAMKPKKGVNMNVLANSILVEDLTTRLTKDKVTDATNKRISKKIVGTFKTNKPKLRYGKRKLTPRI